MINNTSKKKNFLSFLKDKKAALGTRPFIVNVIFVMIFAICIVGFSVSFISINNPNSQVLTNTSWGLLSAQNSLNQSLAQFNSLAGNASAQLSSSTANPATFVFLIFEAAFQIPKLFLSAIISGINTMVTILFPALGGTGLAPILVVLFAGVLAAIIITIVFLIIKTIRTGESER